MLPHTTPIPTQIVSSDEYMPPPQSAKQKEVEARSNLRYGYARRPEASAG